MGISISRVSVRNGELSRKRDVLGSSGTKRTPGTLSARCRIRTNCGRGRFRRTVGRGIISYSVRTDLGSCMCEPA